MPRIYLQAWRFRSLSRLWRVRSQRVRSQGTGHSTDRANRAWRTSKQDGYSFGLFVGSGGVVMQSDLGEGSGFAGLAYCLHSLVPPDFPYCPGESAGSMPTRLIPSGLSRAGGRRRDALVGRGYDVYQVSKYDNYISSRQGHRSVAGSGDQRVKNTTGETYQAMREKVTRNCSKMEEMETSRCK